MENSSWKHLDETGFSDFWTCMTKTCTKVEKSREFPLGNKISELWFSDTSKDKVWKRTNSWVPVGRRDELHPLVTSPCWQYIQIACPT